MSKTMKVVNLPKDLTIEHVSRVWQELPANPKKQHIIILQIGEVDTVDAAGLQLIAAVLQWGRQHNLQVEFSGAVTAPLEIALLSAGFCREVPSEGQQLRSYLLSTVGGKYAG
ncbi:STAS domain-containing protein [Spirochaeta africana]|uniref:STAS domain-containing protein n=1 Tax=Spirochaeta africana (strain ATCC 700263 / DSM 8902 / Z-7692) TaxID=889378 RepID=H9UK82_SPIAZ|nr:STAS domain-containing protein [Spirochaeta africana]AFG37925.1 hypothetical protein Spiaf_1870 [Spirochaeta africana DSM 8902]